jgi:hypothetical protein
VTAPHQPERLLLVLADGIGERELLQVRTGATWSGTMPTAPLRLPGDPVAAVLGGLGAAHELHDLGVAVDRSSLVLRPAGRTDATAIAGVARRTTGPADVTVFAARDALPQAMVGGPVAVAAAAQQLGALLDHLGTVLRRGDAPEVWFVGLGSPVAVHRTFDLAAAWRGHVLPPLAHELTLHHTPGSATVHADNQRALDLAANTLRRAPFARHGRVQAVANGQLHFTAAPHVAFGPRPLAARAPLPHEANGIACAPLGDLVRKADLHLADVMARFWLRAATLHVEPTDDAVETRTAAPQLAPGPAPAAPLAPVPLPQ